MKALRDMSIDELRSEADYSTRRAVELMDAAENQPEAEAEKARQDATVLDQEAQRIISEIERRTKLEETRDKIQQTRDGLLKPGERRGAAPEQPKEFREHDGFERRIEFAVGPKMKSFPNTAEGRELAYRAGLWTFAAILGKPKHQRMYREVMGEARAMSALTNEKGGALVPDEHANAVIQRRDEYGVVFREAQRVPMGSDTLNWPKSLNTTSASWEGENTDGGETDPTLKIIKLVARKLKGFVYVPSELSEDAIIEVGDMIVDGLAWAFALAADRATFLGDATSQFGGVAGFVNLFETAGLKGAVDAASGNQTPEAITHGDLAKVRGALRDYAFQRGTPKFYCSREYAEVIFGRLAAAAGGNTVQTLQGGMGLSYMGYPIVTSEVLPRGGAMDGKVMLLFGAMDQSTLLGDRRQMRVEESTHAKFIEDVTTIKATQRLDINHHDLGSTTETGSMVALLGKS